MYLEESESLHKDRYREYYECSEGYQNQFDWPAQFLEYEDYEDKWPSELLILLLTGDQIFHRVLEKAL